MLMEYLNAGLNHARYEILPDDAFYYGKIPECQGVYANAATLEACRRELREVLEEWVLLRVAKNLPLPSIDETNRALHDGCSRRMDGRVPHCR